MDKYTKDFTEPDLFNDYDVRVVKDEDQPGQVEKQNPEGQLS